MKNLAFNPSALHAKVGQTVEWTNDGSRGSQRHLPERAAVRLLAEHDAGGQVLAQADPAGDDPLRVHDSPVHERDDRRVASDAPTRRSSRPTTSAGCTNRASTPARREQIGRAFARVIAELEGKPTAELRLGLGRDMRLTAPELAAAYREGMCSEGATVLDAGQVGTEMLYLPRRLARARRRPDVHRLAQPEGVHRGQARQARRDRAVGRCRDRRRPRPDRGRPRRAARRRHRRGGRHLRRVPRGGAAFIDPARSSRCGSSSTAATAWPGRWSGRCSSGSGST